MSEILAVYRTMSPAQVSAVLFLLGLVAGSFASVIRHRLPLRRSVVGPRSQCFHCQTPLGARDLVPVLSYLWLRGRCRACHTRIPWHYPVLELALGLGAAAGGLAGGWAGGFGLILLWVTATWVWAYRSGGRPSAGITLVEVLIALALLTVVIIPMLNFTAYRMGGTPIQRQVAVALATSKLEELGNEAYRIEAKEDWPSSGSISSKTVGRYSYRLVWTVEDYISPDVDWRKEEEQLRLATVTVTCNNCRPSMPAVRMVTVLAKL